MKLRAWAELSVTFDDAKRWPKKAGRNAVRPASVGPSIAAANVSHPLSRWKIPGLLFAHEFPSFHH